MAVRLAILALVLASCKGEDGAAGDRLGGLEPQLEPPPPAPTATEPPPAAPAELDPPPPAPDPPARLLPELKVVPAARVPADFVVEMERHRCYGDCPAYTVVIRADGAVVFNGRRPHKGCATGKADPAALRVLVGVIRAAGYFKMPARFRVIQSHAAWATTAIAMGGRRHQIEHRGPDRRVSDQAEAAVRARLTLVEQAIDETAGTARWLKADAPPLAETDPLSTGQIKAAVRAQAAPLRTCDRKGKMAPFEAQVDIAEDGRVSLLGFKQGHPQSACIQEQVLRWSFPRACGATRTTLRIVFEPAPAVTVVSAGPVPRSRR